MSVSALGSCGDWCGKHLNYLWTSQVVENGTTLNVHITDLPTQNPGRPVSGASAHVCLWQERSYLKELAVTYSLLYSLPRTVPGPWQVMSKCVLREGMPSHLSPGWWCSAVDFVRHLCAWRGLDFLFRRAVLGSSFLPSCSASSSCPLRSYSSSSLWAGSRV